MRSLSMPMRSRFVAVVSFAVLTALVALSSLIPNGGVAKAQSSTGAFERSTTGLSPAFFGNVTARENDFFYGSLLAIYKDRYVPETTAGGHFRVAQKGNRSEVSETANSPQSVEKR